MFKVGKHLIGGKTVFIIAEIGINHLGDLSLCKKLIVHAKNSGADAVKLQISNPKYSYNKDSPSYKIFKKNLLNYNDLIEIKNYSKSKKIILFATPGDFQSLEVIKKLSFPMIKISSGLLTNEALIKESTTLKKPIILSTGMGYMSEIKKTAKFLKKHKCKNFAFLKCASLYPCPEGSTNLRSIITLKKNFPKTPIGYSDHSNGIISCIAAVALGAKIIEKHLTLDKNLQVPDQRVSCNPKEFKEMVKTIRYIENILGNENVFPTKEEIKKRSIYHRKIMSVKKISIGEKFSKDNIALMRSGINKESLHPRFFFKILKKKSKKNINSGEIIKKNYF